MCDIRARAWSPVAAERAWKPKWRESTASTGEGLRGTLIDGAAIRVVSAEGALAYRAAEGGASTVGACGIARKGEFRAWRLPVESWRRMDGAGQARPRGHRVLSLQGMGGDFRPAISDRGGCPPAFWARAEVGSCAGGRTTRCTLRRNAREDSVCGALPPRLGEGHAEFGKLRLARQTACAEFDARQGLLVA